MHFDAPSHPVRSLDAAITSFRGTLIIAAGCGINAPALVRGGNVRLAYQSSLYAPALARCRDVTLASNARFDAPALARAGDVMVEVSAAFTAPSLVKTGAVEIECDGGTFSAPALAEAGDVSVHVGAKWDAPALVTARDVYLRERSVFIAPALQQVRHLWIYADSFNAPALVRAGYISLTREALAKPSEISTRRTRHQRALRFFESLRRGFARASRDNTFLAPALVEAGELCIAESASFIAPMLARDSCAGAQKPVVYHRPRKIRFKVSAESLEIRIGSNYTRTVMLPRRHARKLSEVLETGGQAELMGMACIIWREAVKSADGRYWYPTQTNPDIPEAERGWLPDPEP
ncbi:MAG: hypothetical protein NTV08_06880 [Verrucomicrobia bacterium]|nr:hypothetical protein [Verrucomicrobiota bacterium]